MLCAHTVRRLKRGTFEEFRTAFEFDGTLEELEQSHEEAGYKSRREQIDRLVDAVPANGVYEVVDSRVAEPAARS
jgi:alpha-L-fucosidase